MSPRGIARQILEFLESLGLDAVTLVANDTGGALCQFAIDEDPRRIGRVVLTNGDGLDTFPPAAFKPLFALLRKERRARFLARQMRARPLRQSWLGFGVHAGLGNRRPCLHHKAGQTASTSSEMPDSCGAQVKNLRALDAPQTLAREIDAITTRLHTEIVDK